MTTEQRASFAGYVGSRGPWMSGVAPRLCRDRHSAEDLVRTAQARLFARWSRLCAVDDVDAYARTVIVRAHIGERRTARAKRVDLRASPGEAPAVEVDPTPRLVPRDAVEGPAPR